MKKNIFIAFEGIDGSGKTTQARLLTARLEAAGYPVYSTFEPTDSPIGKMIRDIFSRKMEADHRTIACLFVADRLHHLLNETNGLLQKMKEGYIVITDRYYFSSYAYHSVHMPMDWVIAANSMSASLLRPDINIYFDISPELSMQRLKARDAALEIYETLENQKKVHSKYQEAFERLQDIENIFTIRGDRAGDIIANEIWKVVAALIEQ